MRTEKHLKFWIIGSVLFQRQTRLIPLICSPVWLWGVYQSLFQGGDKMPDRDSWRKGGFTLAGPVRAHRGRGAAVPGVRCLITCGFPAGFPASREPVPEETGMKLGLAQLRHQCWPRLREPDTSFFILATFKHRTILKERFLIINSVLCVQANTEALYKVHLAFSVKMSAVDSKQCSR